MIEQTGTMYIEELDFLKEKCNNKRVCEVGSYCGTSSEAIASTAKNLLCIDMWGGDYSFIKDLESREHYQKLLSEGDEALKIFSNKMNKYSNWKFIRGISYEVAKEIPDNQFDVIFIDCDHSYEGVKKDIEAYYSKLKKEGLMIFHDYNESGWPGVKKAVNEWTDRMEFSKGVRTIVVLKK